MPLDQDTAPQVEEIRVRLLRTAPPWQKLSALVQLSRMVRQLFREGWSARLSRTSPSGTARPLSELLWGAESARHIPLTLETVSMSDELWPAILRVIEVLEALQVPYFISGSMASAVHGVPRSTMDADLVADLQVEHVNRFVQALQEDFYVDESMIIDAIHRRTSFNLIHLPSIFKIDIFLPKERPFDRSRMQRRIRVRLMVRPEREAFFSAAEDIILSKLEWFRQGGEISEQQWRDVLGILRVQGEDLDREYLQRWAVELGVADLLVRAWREAGLSFNR